MAKIKKPLKSTADFRTVMSDSLIMSSFSLLMMSITRSYPEVLHPDFLSRKDDFATFFGSLLRVHYYITHDTIDAQSSEPIN